MRKLVLRGLAERKLRSALTAIAVLLGVAMISGAYIETDQIRTAFDDITARVGKAARRRHQSRGGVHRGDRIGAPDLP